MKSIVVTISVLLVTFSLSYADEGRIMPLIQFDNTAKER